VYICLCLGVSHVKIEASIAAGATTIEELAASTEAGTACGGCHEMLERMLRAHEEES
jgi:assimilatory nitrate reductase electron transfer subunit